MKHAKLTGYLLMTMIGGSQLMAAPPSVPKEWQGNQAMSLLSISQQEIQDFSQGKLADYILECPAGACLPLTVALKGNFLALEPTSDTPLYLRVLKSCYVRCEEKENFLFSTDLQKWEGFSEFFTGNLTVSVENLNRSPSAGIGLELNQRSPLK